MRVAIIGAGLFGCVSAIELSKHGHQVTVFETNDEILKNASEVNQARLHTGMHYPRDFETSSRAKADHDLFKNVFPEAVIPIQQIYVVGKGSKVSYPNFVDFGNKLGLDLDEIPCPELLNPELIEGALQVPESTIDISVLRDTLKSALSLWSVEVRLGCPITSVSFDNGKPAVSSVGARVDYDYLIVASYSTVETFASELGISFRPTKKQLTEVVLCKIPLLAGTGITVMDGPFWSTMPYGLSGLHSLTSVVHTPILEATSEKLNCQLQHKTCGEISVANCNNCEVRPGSVNQKIINHFRSYLRHDIQIAYSHSIYAVKSLPSDAIANFTDHRPTELFHSPESRVILVHSVKLGSAISFARDCIVLLSEIGAEDEPN